MIEAVCKEVSQGTLPRNTERVLVHLLGHLDGKSGSAKVAIRTLASEAKAGHSVVVTSLTALEKAGYLTSVAGARNAKGQPLRGLEGTTTYRFDLPKTSWVPNQDSGSVPNEDSGGRPNISWGPNQESQHAPNPEPFPKENPAAGQDRPADDDRWTPEQIRAANRGGAV